MSFRRGEGLLGVYLNRIELLAGSPLSGEVVRLVFVVVVLDETVSFVVL